MIKTARTYAVLICCLLCASCVSPGARVLSAEDRTDCRKIWIWTHLHNHSEVIFRVSDLGEDFFVGAGLEQPLRHEKFVSFSIFDAEWGVGERSKLAALLPSPAAIAVKLYPDSPELRTLNAELAPIAISRDELSLLLEAIATGIVRGEAGQAIRTVVQAEIVELGYPARYYSVLALEPYSAANICHTWVLNLLEKSLGFRRSGPVYTPEVMLRSIDEAFPRSEQTCRGYLNDSARKPAGSVVIGLKLN